MNIAFATRSSMLEPGRLAMSLCWSAGLYRTALAVPNHRRAMCSFRNVALSRGFARARRMAAKAAEATWRIVKKMTQEFSMLPNNRASRSGMAKFME